MQHTEKGDGRYPTRLDRNTPRSRHDHPPDVVMYEVRMEGHYAIGSDTTSVTVVS